MASFKATLVPFDLWDLADLVLRLATSPLQPVVQSERQSRSQLTLSHRWSQFNPEGIFEVQVCRLHNWSFHLRSWLLCKLILITGSFRNQEYVSQRSYQLEESFSIKARKSHSTIKWLPWLGDKNLGILALRLFQISFFKLHIKVCFLALNQVRE